MTLQAFWQALEASTVATYIAGSAWEFPALETLHVIAIVTVVGSIMVVDLRLLGLASNYRPVTQMSKDTLPWTWGAFGFAVLTGVLLFISKATHYAVNPNFQWKMILILLAGVNMAVFHLFTWRKVADWDTDNSAPMAAKIAGGLSLALWVFVVFFARAIGFTLDLYR